MKQVHIKLDENLHTDLRIKCAKLDTTMQEHITELLLKDLKSSEEDLIKKSFDLLICLQEWEV